MKSLFMKRSPWKIAYFEVWYPTLYPLNIHDCTVLKFNCSSFGCTVWQVWLCISMYLMLKDLSLTGNCAVFTVLQWQSPLLTEGKPLTWIEAHVTVGFHTEHYRFYSIFNSVVGAGQWSQLHRVTVGDLCVRATLCRLPVQNRNVYCPVHDLYQGCYKTLEQ